MCSRVNRQHARALVTPGSTAGDESTGLAAALQVVHQLQQRARAVGAERLLVDVDHTAGMPVEDLVEGFAQETRSAGVKRFAGVLVQQRTQQRL